MAQPEPIKIEGLRELRKRLRKATGYAPIGLKVAGNKAAQIVVDEAKPRVPIGPGKGGHARDSIKAASTQGAARVSAGGKKFPYYPWLDFGGTVGPGKRSRRPFLKEGRYIWAAFADKRDEIEQVLADEMANVASEAGFEVS